MIFTSGNRLGNIRLHELQQADRVFERRADRPGELARFDHCDPAFSPVGWRNSTALRRSSSAKNSLNAGSATLCPDCRSRRHARHAEFVERPADFLDGCLYVRQRRAGECRKLLGAFAYLRRINVIGMPGGVHGGSFIWRIRHLTRNRKNLHVHFREFHVAEVPVQSRWAVRRELVLANLQGVLTSTEAIEMVEVFHGEIVRVHVYSHGFSTGSGIWGDRLRLSSGFPYSCSAAAGILSFAANEHDASACATRRKCLDSAAKFIITLLPFAVLFSAFLIFKLDALAPAFPPGSSSWSLYWPITTCRF